MINLNGEEIKETLLYTPQIADLIMPSIPTIDLMELTMEDPTAHASSCSQMIG